MKRTLLTGMVLFVLAAGLLMVGCGGDKTPAGPKQIAFVYDYNSALSQAQAKNQNIVIDFYTDWCKWCKTLDTVTYVDSAVIAMADNMVFAKINAEVDTATAAKYSVNGYPTIVIARTDGTEIDRINGYLPADEFINEVHNYLNGIGTLDYYLAAADTTDAVDIKMKIADKYYGRGDYENAGIYYQKVVDMDPGNEYGFTSDARMQMAHILRSEEKYDEAIKKYTSIMKDYKGTSNGDDAEIYIAIAYRQKGDTLKAIDAFKGFIKNHPESPDTSYALTQIEKLSNPEKTEEGM
jgi:thioredoxin-like negative regulator of GroEL